jgi:hypothetical protein
MDEQTPIPTLETTSEKRFNWTIKLDPKKVAIAIIVLAILGLGFYYKNLLVAATVNGKIISRAKIVKLLEKQGGQNVLDTFINNALIETEARKHGVTVNDDEITGKIDAIRTQIESQGGTLDEALAVEKMTVDDLKYQIKIGLTFEKLTADKTSVSDEEVDKYIKDNAIALVPDREGEMKSQIREQIKQGKIDALGSQYLDELRKAAKIKTYVNY